MVSGSAAYFAVSIHRNPVSDSPQGHLPGGEPIETSTEEEWRNLWANRISAPTDLGGFSSLMRDCSPKCLKK